MQERGRIIDLSQNGRGFSFSDSNAVDAVPAGEEKARIIGKQK